MDRLFAQGVAQGDEFAHRHRAALGTAHRQLQQRIEVAMRCRGQLQHHRIGVFAAIVQIAGGLATQTRAQGADDGLLRDAEGSGLGTINQQDGARRNGAAAVVDINHACGLRKDGAHRLCHCAATFSSSAINLCNDGRLHRRARRHFGNFDICPEARAYGLQVGAQAHGDGVALLAAIVFADQVDLQVASVGAAAQIVLAHQTIEVDGRRATGISLVIAHFGHAAQISAQLAHDGGGLLQRRAFGHIHDNLQF